MWDYMNLVDSYYNYNKHLYKNKNTPVIFVPGLFGSMGDDIFPGTGDWDFGMAKIVYEPFIEMMEELGYKKNTDLFISFYDWRNSCDYSARKYLYNKIEFVKSKTYATKIDLVCHSMGGLVARSYLQSNYYKNDVNNLIMIGTPNAGSPDSYIFWSGGQTNNSGDIKSNLFEIIIQGYLWILRKKHGMDNIDSIREKIKGIGDLLPNKDYGNYLYYNDRNGQMVFIPYNKMVNKNHYLDRINKKIDILTNRNIKTISIIGVGKTTSKYLQIVNEKYEKLWQDGKVVHILKSNEGDGTVLAKSAHGLGDEKYTLNADHGSVLIKSKYIIKKNIFLDKILHRRYRRKNDIIDNNHISISIKGHGDIAIKSNDKKEWINIQEDIEINENKVFIKRYLNKIIWIIISGSNLENIQIKYKSFKKESVNILLLRNGKIIIDDEIDINNNEEVGLV